MDLIITQIWIGPPTINKLGALLTYRVTLMTGAPLIGLAIPSLTYIAHIPSLLWILLIVIVWIRASVISICFTVCFMMVNHSVPPSQMGSANGIAQSMASFVRTTGPVIGIILSLPHSLFSHLSFLFLLLSPSLVCVCCFPSTQIFLLHNTIDN